ncbi:MAG: hypothetical protein HKN83_07595 [Gammaproteobacteria bacterium]|nr:hypothetical protein [Gammaproteobacteria bacterium]
MDVFAITPASSKPLWFLAVICLFLLIILLTLLLTAYASQTSSVHLNSEHLKIKGDFWGREIPLSKLDISSARILNITKDSEYKPKWRTFGTGMPGYASGWFRLRNGEKALLYVTNRNKVVYLPTRDNYSLMLSVAEPEKFMDKLKSY